MMRYLLYCLILWLLVLPSSIDAEDEDSFVYLYDVLQTTLIRVSLDGRLVYYDLDLDLDIYQMIDTNSMTFSDDGRYVAYCRLRLPDRSLQLVMRDIEAQADLFMIALDDRGNSYCEWRGTGFDDDEALIAVSLLPADRDPEGAETPIGRLIMVDAANGDILMTQDGWQSDDGRVTHGKRYRNVLATTQEAVWLDFDATQTIAPEQISTNVIMYARGDDEPYRIFVVEPAERIDDAIFIEGGQRLAVLLFDQRNPSSSTLRWVALDREGTFYPIDVPQGEPRWLKGTSDGYVVFNLDNDDANSRHGYGRLYWSVHGGAAQPVGAIRFDESSMLRLAWAPGLKSNDGLPPFPFADWFAPFDQTPALG